MQIYIYIYIYIYIHKPHLEKKSSLFEMLQNGELGRAGHRGRGLRPSWPR